MRVVVMDEDMREPLTVVEIPHRLMVEVFAQKTRHVRLTVPLTMEAWSTNLDQIPKAESDMLSVVSLRMEPIVKGSADNVLYWVAVPDNPELALLLRAAFLPGQVTESRRREAAAWFQGAMAALR